ncbi:MAG: triose-phosphate isomerase [Actinomycetaceae bacterium]|nr:triose-phosphate isomerase [Arcanobacterium sp.]MDD7686379.1 triose-phosphate isomerase [Actinomycetaceae bacterium]MDY5272659.1 triose-phosphate isomerase family protein [Arcanobacterium sp.]
MTIPVMRRPIVAVSLKMYFNRQRALRYIRDLSELSRPYADAPVRMALLPDHLVMAEAAQLMAHSPLMLGAQDIAPADRGALTGEVSGADLADLGVTVAEIGHYERRTIFAETADMIKSKFAAALRNGLIPLLCVGESVKGEPSAAVEQCLEQIDAAIGTQRVSELWIGYEPYWAIGAAEPATPDYVSAVACGIRAELVKRIDAETNETVAEKGIGAGAGAGEADEKTGVETSEEDAGGQPNLRILYGGSAGPGLLGQLDMAVDGLFLGRFAHNPAAFISVVDEALARAQR